MPDFEQRIELHYAKQINEVVEAMSLPQRYALRRWVKLTIPDGRYGWFRLWEIAKRREGKDFFLTQRICQRFEEQNPTDPRTKWDRETKAPWIELRFAWSVMSYTLRPSHKPGEMAYSIFYKKDRFYRWVMNEIPYTAVIGVAVSVLLFLFAAIGARNDYEEIQDRRTLTELTEISPEPPKHQKPKRRVRTSTAK